MTPDLSIVIVNWNTRDLLAQCLASIFATTSSLALEVFVVDNASSDGSPEMVRRDFPQVILLANDENLGFARANNQAIAQSTGRYVLLLNSDTEVTEGALETLVSFMEATPDAGAVGGQLLFADGRVQTSHGTFPTLFSEMVNTLGLVAWRSTSPASNPAQTLHESVATDWLLGACLMVRRQVVEQVGGLDERFFMYSEEIDWCRRIKEHGWQIYYVPQAQIVHYWRGSSSQNRDRMKVELYRSKFLYFRKHNGRMAETMLRVTVLITSLLKTGWYLFTSPGKQERRNQSRLWWAIALSVCRVYRHFEIDRVVTVL